MQIRMKFLVAVLLCLAACDDKGAPGEPADWDLSQPARPGEARAGQIQDEGALLPGFHADGAVGDFKIYNSKSAFVVQGAQGLHGWLAAGGSLLDAAPVVDEICGPDRLQEIVPFTGVIRVQDAATVEVLADGRDGGPAVIRASGPDRGVNMADAGLPLPSAALHAVFTTEYRLAPDAPYLEMVTTLTNNGPDRLRSSAGDAITPGDATRLFAPGTGFDRSQLTSSGELPFWAAVGEGTSYAFLPEAGKSWSVLLTLSEVIPVYTEKLSIPTGDSESYRRFLVVGTGDVASLQEGMRTVEGHAQGPRQVLSGTVQAGGDMEGVEVLVRGGPGQTVDDAYSHARPASSGAFSLQVPDAEYALLARGPGRPESAPVPVTVAGAAAEAGALDLGPPAYLHYSATTDDGQASACRIQLQQGADAEPGERVVHWLVSAAGSGTEALLPGEYTVTVSRGFEFDLDRQTVTLTAGQTTELTSVLTRVVDTTGFVAADLHSHCTVSIDSTQAAELKATAQVADGLEFVTTTDHDANFDLGPTVQALGLESRLVTAIGDEVSSLYGHFNVFPLSPGPGTAQYFSISWAEYDEAGQYLGDVYPPELWQLARALGARVIQVNHPRSFTDYFNFVGLDAETGTVEKPEAWSGDFDTLELFNGLDSANQVLNDTLPDWYGFLNRGQNYVATGDSDQHEADQMSGNARNYVAVPDDDPAGLDLDVVFDNLLAFRSMVSTGPFLGFTVDGQGLGQTVVPAGGTISVQLEVLAPAFVPVDYVRIVGNGEIVFEESFADPGTPVRFERTIELTPAVDTWYHALAGHSTASPRPLHGKGSLAFTNPIWVDLDGDGFDPPR